MPAAKIMACMIIRIILKCEGRGLWLGAMDWLSLRGCVCTEGGGGDEG